MDGATGQGILTWDDRGQTVRCELVITRICAPKGIGQRPVIGSWSVNIKGGLKFNDPPLFKKKKSNLGCGACHRKLTLLFLFVNFTKGEDLASHFFELSLEVHVWEKGLKRKKRAWWSTRETEGEQESREVCPSAKQSRKRDWCFKHLEAAMDFL